MPPQLKDGDTPERAALRWMTRILAALAHQSKDGTVTISRRSLEAVSDVSERQALFEDRDNRGNLVLRFGSKHSAVYPVESDTRWDDPREARTNSRPRVETPSSAASSPSPSPSPSPTDPQVVPPKTDQKIAQLEATIKKQQIVNRVVAGAYQRERLKRQSLEGMLEGLPEASEQRVR